MSWKYLACATEAALRAGALQRERYGKEFEVHHKGEIDLVTEVDRACEAVILETLRSYFPDHDVVTEETVLERTGSRFLWFVDPLDGTTNFAHGYPFFCTSIALAMDGRVVAGAVYDPLKDELFTAERGAGAHRTAARRGSQTADLLRAPDHRLPHDLRTTWRRSCACSRFMGGRAARSAATAQPHVDLQPSPPAAWTGSGRLQPWDMMAAYSSSKRAAGPRGSDGTPVGLGADSHRGRPGTLPVDDRGARPFVTGHVPEWRNWQTQGT